MERRALGKGLAALIGDQSDAPMVREIPLSQVRANPYQPRKQFEEEPLAELAASIRQYGVLQPVVVRQIANDQFELVAGERRFRASQLAGKTTVPAIVRAGADNQAMLELALIENLQRQDINALDAARAYKLLIEEFGLTHEQMATRLGKTRAAVTNTLRLLQLPPEAMAALGSGTISEGHAKALLSVREPAAQQALLNAIVNENLSVRETEKRAKTTAAEPRTITPPKTAPLDADIRALEQRLAEHLGTRVTIQRGAANGRISIEFYGDDDLQRLLELLGVLD